MVSRQEVKVQPGARRREPDTEVTRARVVGSRRGRAAAVHHLHREGVSGGSRRCAMRPERSEAPKGVRIGQAGSQQRKPKVRR